MSTRSTFVSLFFAVAYLLTGQQALGDVQVLTLKKGNKIQFAKSAKAFHEDFAPTGAGFYEPGLSLVDVQEGATFLVTGIEVRDWSERYHYFFKTKHREISVSLQTLDPDDGKDLNNPLRKNFAIIIETDPDQSANINLDYLSLVN
jgi:hypothetical protein